MVMVGGAAIDYGFATRLETKLQAATDATALLLCQTPLTTSEADLNAMAQTTLAGAMGAANLAVDRLAITSNPRKITLTAHKQSTTFFGGLTGTQRINPGAVSQCATPLPKTFEIALVLDNTGSMAASSGGQSKLQAVQTAATDFVNYVYTSPAFSSATKVAIVPFAAAVAVDPIAYRYAPWIDQNGLSSYHWTNIVPSNPAPFKNRFDVFAKLQAVNRNWGWAGCLEALPYPFNVQDGAPTTKDSYYVPLPRTRRAGRRHVGRRALPGREPEDDGLQLQQLHRRRDRPRVPEQQFLQHRARPSLQVHQSEGRGVRRAPRDPERSEFRLHDPAASAADQQHERVEDPHRQDGAVRIDQHPRGIHVGLAHALAQQRLRGRATLRIEREQLECHDHQQDHHPDDRRHEQLGYQFERADRLALLRVRLFQERQRHDAEPAPDHGVSEHQHRRRQYGAEGARRAHRGGVREREDGQHLDLHDRGSASRPTRSIRPGRRCCETAPRRRTSSTSPTRPTT
ncbi:hypothetical protein ACU4GA_16225 [Methylobacterium oryzae CBMB20]